MKTQNKAFTFVELIVSVWIILLVSIVWFTSYNSSLEKKDNVKVVSDLATINNAFKTFFSETKTLPEASGNKSFYKADWSYAHDASDSAYGVSSFVSDKTFAAKYLNSVPLDPRTGYFYAYAKTIDNKYYEIAWVEKQDNNYKSVVAGNYKTTWDELSNLVREYNWPEFVANNSVNHFPYNPEEKVLTAQINDFSGTITITHNWKQIDQTDVNWVLDTALVTWDKISVWIASKASIYFSDGSKSYLWDTNSVSDLDLSDMSYKEDSNLFTKVKLVLNIWTLWTSASKMSDNSSFEVDSSNTVAAVRWTIFWVSVDTSSNTNVVVIRWAVEVDKINTDWTTLPLINIPSVTDSSGTIIVNQNEAPKWLQVSNTQTPKSSTWAINEIPGSQEDKEDILIWWTDWNEELVNLDIQELTNSWTSYDNFSAKVLVSDKVLKKFDYFKLNNTDTKNFSSLWITWTWVYTLTWWTAFNKISSNQISTYEIPLIKDILRISNWKFELLACTLTKKWEKCSKSKSFIVSEKISYNVEEEAPIVSLVNEWDYSDMSSWTIVWSSSFNDYNWNLSSLNLTTNGSDTFLTPEWASLNETTYEKYNTSSWIFYNNTSGVSSYSQASLPPWVTKVSWPIYNWMNKWVGIFLDNYNPTTFEQDYLKYDIWYLKLSSWSWFAIEMSVRGAALKRTSWTFNLFNLGGTYTLHLDNSNWLKNNYILALSKGDIENFIWDNINDFFKVIYFKENNILKLEIVDSKWKYLISPSISITPTSVNSNDLYIWSNNSKSNQWNDIIDYIKIYKK